MDTTTISMHGMKAFRKYSMMNPWIDFLVIVPAQYAEQVPSKIEWAMHAFWNEDYPCYGDAVQNYLKDIPHIIIYHSSTDESEEYETEWEESIKTIPYSIV